MLRDDHLRLGRDLPLDHRRVNVVGDRLNIDVDGLGAEVHDRIHSHHARIAGKDHLVSFVDTERLEDRVQRHAPLPERKGMTGAHPSGEGFLVLAAVHRHVVLRAFLHGSRSSNPFSSSNSR